MYPHPYALLLLSEIWDEEPWDPDKLRRRAGQVAKDAAPPSRRAGLSSRITALASRARGARLRTAPGITRVAPDSAPDLA
jgi:hypothetical protein